MRTLQWGHIVICSVLFMSCSKNADTPGGNENAHEVNLDVSALLAQEDKIVERAPRASTNQLAFEIYRELNEKTNPVYSPFSISLALAMAYAGAHNETEAAMKRALYFGDNTVDFHKSYGEFASLLHSKDRSQYEATFRVSNQQWLQRDYKILDAFVDVLKQSYASTLTFLNFLDDAKHATQTINEKVKEQTNGEIPKLLAQTLSSRTRLVLTNAIYFNAKWEKQFSEFQTQEDDFTTKGGAHSKAQYMKQIEHFRYRGDTDQQALLLPYRDPDFAAVFILPREGKLEAVEKNLNDALFSALIDSLESTKVDLWLPKFSQRLAPSMKETLSKIGLARIFDPDHADFSRINGITEGEEKLHIDDVLHEAVVKMYESGTTAAAATAISFAKATSIAPPSQPVEFHATRPFLYFIIHRQSKAILFMGRMDKTGG